VADKTPWPIKRRDALHVPGGPDELAGGDCVQRLCQAADLSAGALLRNDSLGRGLADGAFSGSKVFRCCPSVLGVDRGAEALDEGSHTDTNVSVADFALEGLSVSLNC
jgi:hypothetical protein